MQPAKPNLAADVAIIGAGIAGIATAYYIRSQSELSVLLIDSRQPMSYTSAQSGDNYRNWWPHATMTAFTNDSIDELDRFAAESDDVFHMTRGGYALATRSDDVDDMLRGIPGEIEVDRLPAGDELRRRFPALDAAIRNVVHIRRGGDISGQQLGQYLLQQMRGDKFARLTGEVMAIDDGTSFRLTVQSDGANRTVQAAQVVNAAGPFVDRVAGMLGKRLPVRNIYQQKIAFDDVLGAIPRDMPFSIDLDPKQFDWTSEERAMLADDADLAWLAGTLPGGTHCRPEGGAGGQWVKLGWAYNETVSEPQQELANEPAIDPQFPEIVIRGAAAFLPSLRPYIDSPPTRFSHYGGYYTMTEENWPLIGPLTDTGAFVVGALSGFGSMAACAAGKLCAAHLLGKPLPDYSAHLGLERYENRALMTELASTASGLL